MINSRNLSRSNRAPFQVLVIPYRRASADVRKLEYAIFRRNERSGGYWQGIAGGGEGRETSLQAAIRESNEEAGIPANANFLALKSMCTIPVEHVCGFHWGDQHLVIPEYAFAVECSNHEIVISSEHIEYKWVNYSEAAGLLKWDSNRCALWELHERLLR